MSILGRGVGGSKKVKDTFVCAKRTHIIGGEFPIVGDETLDFVRGVKFKGCDPVFQDKEGVTFGAEREGPDVRGKVIDYIHRIKTTRTRRN